MGLSMILLFTLIIILLIKAIILFRERLVRLAKNLSILVFFINRCVVDNVK